MKLIIHYCKLFLVGHLLNIDIVSQLESYFDTAAGGGNHLRNFAGLEHISESTLYKLQSKREFEELQLSCIHIELADKLQQQELVNRRDLIGSKQADYHHKIGLN